MPEEVEQQARKELKRPRAHARGRGRALDGAELSGLADRAALVKLSDDNIDIAEARKILDEDHYGLPKIKQRILEYLAVRKLNRRGRARSCASSARPASARPRSASIARATGRKFVRASLGGVHDEAEIRGHRRTYIGALFGNIVQGIRKAGTQPGVHARRAGQARRRVPRRPVLGAARGAGSGAEQHVPRQLSRRPVRPQPGHVHRHCERAGRDPPLRDRMEVIELPSYTEDEKVEIAERYLVKRQLEANGLKPEQVEITEGALRTIVREYTREAGVRNPSGRSAACCAMSPCASPKAPRSACASHRTTCVRSLGARRFENEVAIRTCIPGVATGLAWTPVGGDVLFVEATRTTGTGKLILTDSWVTS